ncbi:helix-turn-helix domain-containing protein [Ruminococcus sp. XPD3002]|uniref:helix-turn-helix domain-containing protein n=1 Tax=Ruminococcus sp. XPD3002 TaxID=1452269 RepID=UPI00092166A3|nr:Helix-turn-helix domain-containing protein [Ruminococcus flavefaciens]
MSQESVNKFAERYKRIGLNIALQRKMKGLTQIQLAEKIGISRTHMSNIEAPNMLTPVSLEVIFEIIKTRSQAETLLSATSRSHRMILTSTSMRAIRSVTVSSS